MFGKLKRLDEGFISLLQEGYLWLWDRTGVYMATLQLLTFSWTTVVAVREISREGLGPGWHILIIIIGVFNFLLIGHRYYQQGSSIKNYNSLALAFQENWLRHYFTLMLLGLCLPQEIWHRELVSILQTLTLAVYNYSFLVLIRERDKKPFFKFKLAPAEAT